MPQYPELTRCTIDDMPLIPRCSNGTVRAAIDNGLAFYRFYGHGRHGLDLPHQEALLVCELIIFRPVL